MHREQKMAIGLGLFSLLYIIGAWKLPRSTMGGAVVGAHVFPLILGGVLLLLCLLSFLQSSRLPKASSLFEGVDRQVLVLLVGSAGIYALVLSSLGFVLATTLFLTAAMYVLGRRGWGHLAATAAGFSLLTYGLFSYGLQVPLAKGILPF